jgi:hypothetical protein
MVNGGGIGAAAGGGGVFCAPAEVEGPDALLLLAGAKKRLFSAPSDTPPTKSSM